MCPQPGADEQKAKGPGRYLYMGTLGDSIPKLFVKKRMLIILFLFLSHVTCSLREAGGLGSCEELEQVLVISPLYPFSTQKLLSKMVLGGGAKSPVGCPHEPEQGLSLCLPVWKLR